MIKLSILLT